MQNLNIYGLLATFLVSLLILHWVLLRVFNLGPVIWKRIDLYWLLASLIAACVSLQAIAYSEKKDETQKFRQELMAIKRDLLGAVDAGTNFACGNPASSLTSIISPKATSASTIRPNSTQSKPDMRICNWFKDAQFALHQPYENMTVPQPLTNSFNKLIEQRAQQFPDERLSGRVRSLAENYQDALDRLQKSEISTDTYGAWKFILQLTSYLIAFLLALRITKSTADILMESEKNRLSPGKAANWGAQPKWGKALQSRYTEWQKSRQKDSA